MRYSAGDKRTATLFSGRHTDSHTFQRTDTRTAKLLSGRQTDSRALQRTTHRQLRSFQICVSFAFQKFQICSILQATNGQPRFSEGDGRTATLFSRRTAALFRGRLTDIHAFQRTTDKQPRCSAEGQLRFSADDKRTTTPFSGRTATLFNVRQTDSHACQQTDSHTFQRTTDRQPGLSADDQPHF